MLTGTDDLGQAVNVTVSGASAKAIEAAAELDFDAGIQRLVGEVMGENEPMLGLLKHLGFKLKASEEPGVVRAIFELRPPSEA